MKRPCFKKYLILLFFNAISIVVILVGSRYTVKCYRSTPTETLRSSQTFLKTKALNNIVDTILDVTRSTVKLELLDYNFTYSNVDKLEDLLLESGGRPVRNIITSTWRSGSSFLGDFINSMPSNFYSYEPLMTFKVHQIRGPVEGKNATDMIKKILQCDYVGLEDYFTYAKSIKNTVNQIEFNKRVWNLCKYKEDLCFDANFTTAICKLFPFQSVKLVRLRLSLMEDILANVEVLRYEDLILNYRVVIPELLNFLSFGPTTTFDEFLYAHTNADHSDPYSTFRISRNVPFKWMKSMDFDHVIQIQEKCKKTMELWGYQLAQNASHMASKNFSSLLPYSVTPKQNYY